MVCAALTLPARLGLLTLTLPLAACVHTPPGEPVVYKLARKAEVVRLPESQVAAQATTSTRGHTGATVEPRLPQPTEDDTVKVADAYSRGVLCVGMGNNDEAIRAFQEAVRLDPKFTGAWQYLASLYEQTGNAEKAKEAFKKAKAVPQ